MYIMAICTVDNVLKCHPSRVINGAHEYLYGSRVFISRPVLTSYLCRCNCPKPMRRVVDINDMQNVGTAVLTAQKE